MGNVYPWYESISWIYVWNTYTDPTELKSYRNSALFAPLMHTLLVTVDHAADCHEVYVTNIFGSSISIQDVTHLWFLYAYSAHPSLTWRCRISKTCPTIVGLVLQFSWLTPRLLVISKVCKSCPFRAPRMKTNLNYCSPWDLGFTHAAVRISQ